MSGPNGGRPDAPVLDGGAAEAPERADPLGRTEERTGGRGSVEASGRETAEASGRGATALGRTARDEPDAGPRPAVSCRDLSVRYGSTRALEGVSLDVGRRTIQAIVGPSGCGKSSFLMALNRLTDLVSGCEVRGSVRVGATDVYDPETDLRRLRRRVGMVFQKPNPFPVSVRENLAIPLRDHGVRDRDALETASRRALEAVGLWDEVSGRMDEPAPSLSGGQQQRLCIARALVLEPQILLMDEPCSALDPLSSGRVEDYIEALGEDYTVIVVTHNLAQAHRIADRTALFWRRDGAGRLVEEASTAAFFDSPRHELTRAYVEGRRG